MGKDTKTNASSDAKEAHIPLADIDAALAKGASSGAEVKLTPEEQVVADIRATVIAVMDHVLALTVAVQAIAVGGRRPQNVRELDEAVAAAREFRKTL